MAGDWIKMRADLFTHPKVDRICELLGKDEFYVVGALFAFWAWADKHAVDGRVDGGTSRLVDRATRADGLASALIAVSWLAEDASGISLPNFQEHNGDSAKERSLKNQRQARWREKKAAENVDASVDAPVSTKASTREEKRREEEKKEEEALALIPLDDGTEHPVTASDIAEFRTAYPRIDPLAECRKARSWCLANATNRKTRRGVGKFLNGWMARAQKDAEGKPQSTAALPGGGRRAL